MPTGHCDEKTQLDTSVALGSACTQACSIGNNNEDLEICLLSQAMIFLVSQRHGVTETWLSLLEYSNKLLGRTGLEDEEKELPLVTEQLVCMELYLGMDDEPTESLGCTL